MDRKDVLTGAEEEANSQQEQQQKTHRKYDVISFEKRKQLIFRVTKQRQKISRVSAQLGIKLSTSKFILRSYQRSGRIFRKRVDEADEVKVQCPSLESSNREANQVARPQVETVYVPVPIYIFWPEESFRLQQPWQIF